jgi:hypothetical protein
MSSESKPHKEAEVKARELPKLEAPFLWQSKQAFERIKRAKLRNPATAILVYVALTHEASDAWERLLDNQETFTAEIATIAAHCCLGYRTVIAHLKDLEKAGVVHIQRSEHRIPHTYTLCTTRRTKGRNRRTFCKRQQQSIADTGTTNNPLRSKGDKKEGNRPASSALSASDEARADAGLPNFVTVNP